ncbi:MAG: dTDP-4-amino-4,6-dideoxygalactose transaminase [Bacteroidia bacterium]|nr:dTDP-4-amino-4,6-dideoxygalactose transaminase [Bacteroidia bacterium]
MIPFNKPYISGKELDYIRQAFSSGKISGDGIFTKKCHDYFEKRYHFKKCLLTTSCTDALEMAAILIDIHPGDEVIMPSYTFVSTANAFVLRGAKIIFCDSRKDHPGIDEEKIKSLITAKTKAIVPVHYAGVACDMDKIMSLAHEHKLFVIEDAAQAIDSFYTGKDGVKRALGSIGHFGTFSFHETKNISSGEGGMLVINDERFVERAEIIREKGTNRSKFFRGEVDKYGWVDIGSSFLPSDIIAAFLFAQLEQLDTVQQRRREVWENYYNSLQRIASDGWFSLPVIPDYATNNSHMFYVLCNSLNDRSFIIELLKSNDILSVFHYLALHKSPYYSKNNKQVELHNSDEYTNRLLRLPLYFELSQSDQSKVTDAINFNLLFQSRIETDKRKRSEKGLSGKRRKTIAA